MTFQEKLRRLAAEVNKSRLSRSAHLGPTAVSTYLAKGSIPRLDIALKMARAFDVPLEWLADDAQDWPPPGPPTTEELACALGARMLPLAWEIMQGFDQAGRIDWVDVAEELCGRDVSAPLPQDLADKAGLPATIRALVRRLQEYDPRARLGERAPAELLRAHSPDHRVGAIDLWIRHENFQQMPGYPIASALAEFFTVPPSFRPEWFMPKLEDVRRKAREALPAHRERQKFGKEFMKVAERMGQERRKKDEAAEAEDWEWAKRNARKPKS